MQNVKNEDEGLLQKVFDSRDMGSTLFLKHFFLKVRVLKALEFLIKKVWFKKACVGLHACPCLCVWEGETF